MIKSSHAFIGFMIHLWRLRRQQDIVVLWELSLHPAVENDETRNKPKIVDQAQKALCFGRCSSSSSSSSSRKVCISTGLSQHLSTIGSCLKVYIIKYNVTGAHRSSTKTRRDKDLQNKLIERCRVCSCRCSCPKSPAKQLTFWYTSIPHVLLEICCTTLDKL